MRSSQGMIRNKRSLKPILMSPTSRQRPPSWTGALFMVLLPMFPRTSLRGCLIERPCGSQGSQTSTTFLDWFGQADPRARTDLSLQSVQVSSDSLKPYSDGSSSHSTCLCSLCTSARTEQQAMMKIAASLETRPTRLPVRDPEWL